MTEMTRHHRKARCIGGKTKQSNISVVSATRHEAFHTLFGIGDPELIARYLTNVWIDPDYEMVAVRKQPTIDPRQMTLL
jgi:hypothetical protein